MSSEPQLGIYCFVVYTVYAIKRLKCISHDKYYRENRQSVFFFIPSVLRAIVSHVSICIQYSSTGVAVLHRHSSGKTT